MHCQEHTLLLPSTDRLADRQTGSAPPSGDDLGARGSSAQSSMDGPMGYHPVPATCQISEIPPARFTVRRARKHSNSDAHSKGVKTLGLGLSNPGHPGQSRPPTTPTRHFSAPPPTPDACANPLLQQTRQATIVYAHAVQYGTVQRVAGPICSPMCHPNPARSRHSPSIGPSRPAGQTGTILWSECWPWPWSRDVAVDRGHCIVVVVADSHSPSPLADHPQAHPNLMAPHFHPRKHPGSGPWQNFSHTCTKSQRR